MPTKEAKTRTARSSVTTNSSYGELPWHASQRQQWQQQRRMNKIPHAVLLTGPVGLGKRQFAHYMANTLVCTAMVEQTPCGECRACRQIHTASHPDVQEIQPEENYIKVDAIRALIHTTNLTTETWQIFIITPAETMHPSAANALLKTLEEPAPNTLLILSSAEPQRLPATIRSRCQIMHFNPVETTQAMHWLEQQQPGENWQPLLALAAYAPLLAIQAMASGRLDKIHQLVEQLGKMRSGQQTPMSVVKVLAERPLPELINDMIYLCHDMVHLAVCNDDHDPAQQLKSLYVPTEKKQLITLMQGVSLNQLFGLLDQLNTIKKQQNNNLNPVMAVEKIIVGWTMLKESMSES